MTVVINCRFLTQPVTGVQRFADRIVDHLTQQRNDLVLVAPQGDLKHHEYNGVPVERVGTHQGHLWEQLDLPRYLRKRHDRPLLLNLANTGPVFWKNHVFTLHDISYVRYPQSYSRQFRLVYNALVPRLLRSARAVLTVSEFSKNEIHEYYQVPRDKLTVIYNAVEDSFAGEGAQPATVPNGVPYFLIVASLNVHKNVEPFVEAFTRYRAESGSQTELWIAGGMARSFAQIGEGLGARDGVRALGRVSDDELVWLYKHARAFAFPSLYEGFGIPPLEAQRAGTAVLAADIPSLREVLRESALFVSPLSDDELRQGLTQLDVEHDLRDRVAADGRENVRRFSWDESGTGVSKVITSIDRSSRAAGK